MASPRAAAAGALAAVVAWLAFYMGWLLAPSGTDAARLSPTQPTLSDPGRCVLSTGRDARARGLRGFWADRLAGVRVVARRRGALERRRARRRARCPFPGGRTQATSASTADALALVCPSPGRRCGDRRSGAARRAARCRLARAAGWWWLVLRDVRSAPTPPSLVGLGYPVLDLVLLCTIAAPHSSRRGVDARGLARRRRRCGRWDRRRRLHPARAPDATSPGRLVDLGWQLQACLICLAAVAAAFGIGRRANWAQRRSPLRIRTAASMTAALLVILLVLVVEGAAASRRRAVVGFVVASPRCCSSEGGARVSRPTARRAATRSRASTTSPICTTSFVGSPRPRGSTGSRSRSCSCACRGGMRTRRSAGSSGPRASSTSSRGSTTAGSQSFWRGSRSPARPRRPSACASDPGPLRPPASRSGGKGGHGRRCLRTRRAAARRGQAARRQHTRGPKPDVLVHGHPRLGLTAFGQLLELAAGDRRPLPDRARALSQGRDRLARPRARSS